MDELIRLLQQFENDISIIHDRDDFILDEAIQALACELLITKDGTCNLENISILEKNGFYVEPIDEDSFGWLVAGILTKNGIITYG